MLTVEQVLGLLLALLAAGVVVNVVRDIRRRR